MNTYNVLMDSIKKTPPEQFEEWPISKLLPEQIPPLLRTISWAYKTPDQKNSTRGNPIDTLYICGNEPQLNAFYICIVGSRKATPYGKDAVSKLLTEISHLPVYIVSGLAYGIDIHVHKTALQLGLKCIAVPGSGLCNNVLYPNEHSNIAKKIITTGGCLFSPFEPNFVATPWSFPVRNNLMAGMSHITIIIEGALQSGSLITATSALNYNRTVCAVPGSIFETQSAAPNSLILEGAHPVTCGQDIINLINQWHPEILKETPKENVPITKMQQFENFPACEKNILEVLTHSMSLGDISGLIDNEAAELTHALSRLEIKGVIEKSAGLYRKKFFS